MNSSRHKSNESGSVLRTVRRQFLAWASAALGTAAAAAAGIPIVGFLIGSVVRPTPDEWVELGAVDDFPEDQTRIARFTSPDRQPWDGEVGRDACYVRRIAGDHFQVFAVNCAHLGCPVSWFKESGLFLCPCHGGVYYADGSRASGPPPRGLYQYAVEIRAGKLWIRAGHLPTLEDPASAEVDA